MGSEIGGGDLSLPEIAGIAASSLVDEKEKTKEEYLLLLAAFRRMIVKFEDSAECWQIIEEIITLRSSFLIDRVLQGMNIDFDRALDLLRNHNDFSTELERKERDTIIAAIDNLVEFAAAEEWQMLSELPDVIETDKSHEYEEIFSRYNLQYALQENADVMYAGGIAALWLRLSEDAWITYMTVGDERVRDSHRALEGLTYPKHQFPAELIPPIEYRCRCYLVESGYGGVMSGLECERKNIKINPVFRESLATGGRIFSSEHPYFKQALPLKLKEIVRKIKQKLYIG